MATRRTARARTGKGTARNTASRKAAPVKAAHRATSSTKSPRAATANPVKSTARRAAGTQSASAASEATLAAAFPADCTIAQADDIKARLARLVSKPASVKLDLSAVRRIDTA